MDSRLLQAFNEVLGNGSSQAQMMGTPMAAFAAGQATKRRLLVDAVGRNASTGTPISSLRGIARAKAALAVVGDGALSAGGRGIEGGAKSLRNNAIAVELAIFGISGAVTVGRIAVRYRALVRADKAGAAEAARVERDDKAPGDAGTGTP